MTITSRITQEAHLHRDLAVPSLFPPLLWRQGQRKDGLNDGELKRIQALVVRIGIQSPTDIPALMTLMNNDPQTMVAVFNGLYSNMVNHLGQVGGMIVDMRVNEVVALFVLEGEAQAGLVHRALVAVEKAIAQAQEKTHPQLPTIQWRLSSGVGLGSVLLAVIGSNELERKAFLIDGPALYQARDALAQAKPNQVLAHRDVMKRLGTAPNGRWIGNQFFLPQNGFASTPVAMGYSKTSTGVSLPAMPSGNPTLDYELSLFLDPVFRIAPPFIPLQNGIYARRVVSLVIRVQDLSLVNEGSVEQWQAILKQVVEIAARYEGIIEHIAAEEKYGEIRLLFGIPQTRDNVSSQATGCALALQRALTDIDPSVRISLAGQRAFGALMGSATYSTYIVVSSAIEKATSLLNYAKPLEILAERGIQQATERQFAWRTVVSIDSGEGDTVYALAGEVHLGSGLRPRHNIARRISLVGREEEQQQLAQIVENSLSGKNHLLLVTGERGHGRSALIDEAITRWLDAEGNGFIAIGPSYAPSAPYSLWIPIWQALFELALTDTPESNLRKLGQTLSRLLPDVDWATSLFANVLGLATDAENEIEELAPMARQQRLFDTTLAILKKLANVSPIMVVFEFLDHVDNLSLDLLLQITEALEDEPILFCIEDRGMLSYSLRSLFFKAQVVAARPLNSKEAWQLFEQLVPNSETFPDAYLLALEERLGHRDDHIAGRYVPFDVVALATALRAVALKANDQGWDFENSAPPEFWPQDTIEAIDVLLKDALKGDEAKIAIRAAVGGMMFYHDSPWIKGKTTTGLIELRRVRELNLCEPYIDEGHLRRWERFRHQLVRETLYSFLGITERATRHQMAVEWVREYTPGKAGMATVANHAEHAGDVLTAFHAYLLASEHAAEWGASGEAMQCLLAAERLITRHHQLFENTTQPLLRISLIKANLYLWLEKIDQGLIEVNHAIQYCQELGDPVTLARCLVLRGRFAQLEKNYYAMQQDALKAIALARGYGDTATHAQGLWLHARGLYANQRNAEAARFLKQAIELSETTKISLVLRIEMALDATRILLADYQRDRAYKHAEQATRYAQQLGDPMILHQVYTQRGNLQLYYGKAQESLEALETALSLPPPSDSTIGNLGSLLISHAAALCYSGRYTDAQATFDAATDYFLADDNEISMLEVNIIRAHELLLDTNGLEAAQNILQMLDGQRDRLSQGMQLLADLTQAEIHIRHKAFDAAKAILDAIEQLPNSSGKRWFAPLLYLRAATLEVERADYDRAQDYAYEALGAIGTLGDLRYLTAVYCLLAEVMILREADEEAIEDALDRALRTAREHGRKLHHARTVLLSGYHFQHISLRHKTRARASTYRFEADQLYKEMGLPLPEKIASYEVTRKEQKVFRF